MHVAALVQNREYLVWQQTDLIPGDPRHDIDSARWPPGYADFGYQHSERTQIERAEDGGERARSSGRRDIGGRLT